MHKVTVMGDLNETLTRWDRFTLQPTPVGAGGAAALFAASSPINCLQLDGFTDVYRALHPSAELAPGFTHTIDGARPVRSRLDYVWVKGSSRHALLRVDIDGAMLALSHHRLLWAELRMDHSPAAPCSTPLLRLRLPNLRAATEEHKATFTSRLQRAVITTHAQLDALALADDADMLDLLASRVTGLVHRAAFSSFPITGPAPRSSAAATATRHHPPPPHRRGSAAGRGVGRGVSSRGLPCALSRVVAPASTLR